MNANYLTRSAFNFLGGIYEEAVDRGYNVVEIQAHLSRRGIHKSVAAVKHDLDNVFQFHQYAATHPAPPIQTYAQIDAQLSRPARKPIELVNGKVGVYNCLTDVRQSYTPKPTI